MENSVSENIYKCSPSQTKRFVEKCLLAGLVPNIVGSPGIGKSSIVRDIAKKYNLKLIDVRLSTCDPTDLNGLPHFDNEGKAYFAPFNQFPIEGDPLPKGKDGFLLFLDEFNSCSRAVAVAAYKLVLDRYVGQFKLHPNVAIVCAGNLSTDRAIVNTMSTAMQSRLVHIEMEVNFDDWLKEVAIPEKYDSRIIAFLNNYPSKLMDFKPEHQEKTFTCPRTWSFVNALIKDKPIETEDINLLAGTITSGMAAEFVNYTKVFQGLPKLTDILTQPDQADVPSETAQKWAITSIMLEHIDEEKNMGSFCMYMNRFDLTFRILFLRAVLVRHPEYKNNVTVQNMIMQNAKYLYE